MRGLMSDGGANVTLRMIKGPMPKPLALLYKHPPIRSRR